jgi:hypothetical protein
MPPVTQRQVHPDGQHQHREADLPEREHGRVLRMDPVEHRRADEDAGEDLAGDDWHEAPLAEHRQQRAAETGEHEHDERSKAHAHRCPPAVSASGERERRSLSVVARDRSVLQAQNAVKALQCGGVVGDHQQAAIVADVKHVRHHAHAQLGVEVRGGLIKDQEARRR